MPDDIPRLPPRDVATHKGDYGHVVVVAGSVGMTGAAALTTLAALRSGAGLVTLLCPDGAWSALASRLLEAMVKPVGKEGARGWDGAAARGAAEFIAGVAKPVVAIGPGMGRSTAVAACVRTVFASVTAPVVVDADGLVAFANDPEALRREGPPVVLTPHPGEAARLVGPFEGKDDEQRARAARSLAERTRAVVILKGHRSVVTDGTRLVRNETGNPGMATGGSGDVLTGVTASLLAAGLGPFDAARLAAHVHGAAGDIAASQLGQASLIAGDIVRALPEAFRQLDRPT